MERRPLRIFPLGENALTVEFGETLSEQVNDAAISLADHFNNNPFPGFIEAVPAMASTTVFYSCHEVRSRTGTSSALESVKELIATAVESAPLQSSGSRRIIEVPVSFSAGDSIDLEHIAASTPFEAEEVIAIFTSRIYRVFMLGFLPGFAYMGSVDERIAVPRRATPRTAVPAGSVGIAGAQTGIYPSRSPGGWQIIGRTPVQVLHPGSTPPCVFSPGDRVRFVRADGDIPADRT